MHARLLRSSRSAIQAVQAGARLVAPSSAAVVLPARSSSLTSIPSRSFGSSSFLRSDSPSSTSTPVEATQEPAASPAPIDQQAATELPTEEISAVSSSLDATTLSAETTETSAAPAPDAATSTTPEPTAEEIAEKVSRTVFVAGLSWSVDEDVLREEILKVVEAEEGVNQVRIATDPAGRSKGFAFVELASTDLTEQLLRSPTFVIDDREAVVRQSKSPVGAAPARGSGSKKYPTQRGAPNARYPPGQTIYVGNVAWSADEIALEEVFSRYGNIKRINQPKDGETGRSTGVAFIEYEDLDAAQKAFRAGNGRGIKVDGRPVRIDFAKNGTHKDGERTTSAAGGKVE